MFERYNEPARRVIFFARYEVSKLGSTVIETEHLLLGLLREDGNLVEQHRAGAVEDIRRRIRERTPPRSEVSTAIDLPLSNECKRILSYAGEEADRLEHRDIKTDHLLLGILRVPTCVAVTVLTEAGIPLDQLRESTEKSASTARETAVEKQQKLPWEQQPWLKEFKDDMKESWQPGDTQAQRSSSSRWNQDGGLVVETRQVIAGHRVFVTEQFQLSDDGKTLVCTFDVVGPKAGQRHRHSVEFDVTPDS